MKTIVNDESGTILIASGYFADRSLLDAVDSFELKQETICLFGKEINQPRLSALYGAPNTSYKYSGKLFVAIPWQGALKQISEECSKLCKTPFNTGLLNYYRNGMDSMGLHADDEKELGDNPVIASVSYGTTRKMIFRKRNSKEKIVVPLNHGDLLIMRGALQYHWKHELPKEKRVEEARLNITFRFVRTETELRS